LQIALPPAKRSALCIAGKSQIRLEKACVKRVTVLPWFHPRRPLPLLAQPLWGFRFRAFEDGFSAPGMLPRLGTPYAKGETYDDTP
jgi:hypothetical protein